MQPAASDLSSAFDVVTTRVASDGGWMQTFVWEPQTSKLLGSCILLPEIFGITDPIKAAAARIAKRLFCKKSSLLGKPLILCCQAV